MKKTAQERGLDNYISDVSKQISSQGYTKDETGYYKLGNNGEKEYLKRNNKIVSDLTGIATEQMASEIKNMMMLLNLRH